MKEFGDYSRGMKKALNLKRSLDKATRPQMCAILSAQKTHTNSLGNKRKNTRPELTEAEDEKPLAENAVTASKHGKNTHAKINTMPTPLVNQHRITEANKKSKD